MGNVGQLRPLVASVHSEQAVFAITKRTKDDFKNVRAPVVPSLALVNGEGALMALIRSYTCNEPWWPVNRHAYAQTSR
ncbi:MAG: hypothetical protein IPM34_13225 [Saprospiraceae bacterium]|nr:hypothetical protein [Saprospiraceae bacterium]